VTIVERKAIVKSRPGIVDPIKRLFQIIPSSRPICAFSQQYAQTISKAYQWRNTQAIDTAPTVSSKPALRTRNRDRYTDVYSVDNLP
jgi:glycerol-3-phosphate dehydrogenase